jgi:hypothetical protein
MKKKESNCQTKQQNKLKQRKLKYWGLTPRRTGRLTVGRNVTGTGRSVRMTKK